MTFYRKDYQAPNFDLAETRLTFTLNPQNTLVESELDFENAVIGKEIILNGEDLELKSFSIPDYKKIAGGIVFKAPAKKFTLKTSVLIHPDKNTALAGLYVSDGLLTTQNEPEGFRHITYFPDHPDVMSHYIVKIKANKKDVRIIIKKRTNTRPFFIKLIND